MYCIGILHFRSKILRTSEVLIQKVGNKSIDVATRNNLEVQKIVNNS